MIESALSTIYQDLTSLPFVQRFGGLVRIVSRQERTENQLVVKQTFPIAQGINDYECWNLGKYEHLVPNDRLASVFYFEDVGDFTYQGRYANSRHLLHFSGQARLVGWLNLPMIGKDSNIPESLTYSAIQVHLLKTLNKTYNNVTQPFKMYKVVFSVASEENRHNSPFEKYSYDEYQQFLIYPFDWISLVVKVDLIVAPDCLGDLTLNEYDCVDFQEEE